MKEESILGSYGDPSKSFVSLTMLTSRKKIKVPHEMIFVITSMFRISMDGQNFSQEHTIGFAVNVSGQVCESHNLSPNQRKHK